MGSFIIKTRPEQTGRKKPAAKGGQKSINFTKRGQNSEKAAKILEQNKKEYQQLLKAEIRKQSGKKDVCRAAKAASKKYKKMTWRQALKKAGKA